jgi:peroxiredoxin
MKRALVLAQALVLTVLACGKEPNPATPNEAGPKEPPKTPTTTAAIAPDARADIGKPAPDFTLRDLDGNDVKLSSFKGKVVVLEWFNPGCPFVRKSHGKGSLKELAKKRTQEGVVWLAVNSSAPGKEGSGVDANKKAAAEWGLTHPILLDESGAVGHAFAATNTPHMFVVDDKGTLVYRGAIDNSPDAEGESAPDGKLVVYVDEALAAIKAGRPVATATTKAYGCSVKYAR